VNHGNQRSIELRGVEVHNLQQIDLDIPRRRLIVICGVSGSGKSSLALDTLYAEGQRRYIESFSAYTRQFLEQLERPAAERIDGLPPTIAVGHRSPSRSNRSTVGTATEALDYLRLLFAKIGRIICTGCGQEVRRDNPQLAAQALQELPDGTRFVVAFPRELGGADPTTVARDLHEDGFVRAIVGGRTVALDQLWEMLPPGAAGVRALACHGDNAGDSASEQAKAWTPTGPPTARWYVIVDRLTAGHVTAQRLADSLETAFAKGEGHCAAFVEDQRASSRQVDVQGATAPGSTLDVGRWMLGVRSPVDAATENVQRPTSNAQRSTDEVFLDGEPWRLLQWSTKLCCETCGLTYLAPEPRLFSFNNPLGACPVCEGFGDTLEVDMDLVVPEPGMSIRDGAIAPWKTPSYAHELEELLALAGDYGIPVDVPFAQLDERSRRLIAEGVPERNFGGLRGFFAWLERKKYKMPIRVFLSRWRSYRTCQACGGRRLRPEALATRIGGLNIAEVSSLKIKDAIDFFRSLPVSDWEREVARIMLDEVVARLGYLVAVGLDYLALDRPLRTLSGGEAHRVALTSALGTSLVNMLYVLDEPSQGLHPRDTQGLIAAVSRLRDRGNTVVVVEHDEAFLRTADQVIEIGPGAGQNGGRVVFQGTPAEMEGCTASITGDYLAGRRTQHVPARRREPRGRIRLAGARGRNLRDLTVDFPLAVLCIVTGVSGSGKSTLVQDTLYGALARRLGKSAPRPLECDDVFGDGAINDVVLVDQNPLQRSARSNPVTYVKAFDAIRTAFAETVDARTRNYPAGYFSFNAAGGRCEACHGEGQVEIDMQFLADVYMKCPECHGTRYRREVLDVLYRGRNIAQVLEMTVREAFAFFRGQRKAQLGLQRLIDVGLDYLRLGQPANTLSGGEAQRLKLAGHLAAAGKNRTLFLLDEPTTGLHFSDIVKLQDCFDALLDHGHSLVIVEHNLQLMQAADYIIDLGPGAADEGGQIVTQGTPEKVAACEASVTGAYLRTALEKHAAIVADGSHE
jgi:excinuclease ABC subunit A